ncbi:TPA: conjugal transfer protein TraD [Legionella pneumophila]|nr:conjugal transfer protein TraD [Legionella pneumophila]
MDSLFVLIILSYQFPKCKIEFGGLIIKSGLDKYIKFIILGLLRYSLNLMQKDQEPRENKYILLSTHNLMF